ncbi:cytochrome ubiquinol oxidase subunit I [Prevotella sp. MA2016]|uniref:cytochrome ubiquinol oxidase subunit I n=1 Tax=Prevotella sp. MA2016 TaxID=1408310 RepID=UPI00048CE133|nr:cytochrome ubiquinol oxidase subunit I [Prevotella sp. MA2016]
MLQNLILNIDAGTIDWSRAQFALTAIYHWLFVPLTLGLAVIMGIVETKYYQTRDDFWKESAKFWQKLFGINFAMGVATGIILEFEFGTNWSNYSWFVGDIFGAPLAVEGIVAFFMESTFVAVMFFGWQKVSAGFHLASTWLTGLGATISAWWILVANAWMQYPVGCEFNPDTMRNEMVSFADVALSPFAVSKFCHTITSSWIIGAIFCVGVCCWYLMKKRHTRLALESMKIGAGVGLVAALLAAATGHKSGMDVAEVQPMKLAAMEALYDGGTEQGLKLVEGIEIPYGLSIMATNDPQGYVPGINDLLNGYTTPDGKTEPSADEKIARGKKAIAALAAYRKAKADGAPDSIINRQLSILNSNIKFFGYGYVKDKSQLVPPVAVNFWAFRIMVGVGCLFIAFFAVILAVSYRWPKFLFGKRDITTLPAWHYWLAIALIPLAYIGSECGWLVAEFGRQPWTIQDMLPTWVAVSDLQSSSVITTFFLFLILFTTMLAVEINILLKQIKKGPAV